MTEPHKNPLLPVPPGTTVSKRTEMFEGEWIHVRNLGIHEYKVITYNDALENRDECKKRILEYEISKGWIVPDDGSKPTTSVTPMQPPVQTPQALPAPIAPVAPIQVPVTPAAPVATGSAEPPVPPTSRKGKRGSNVALPFAAPPVQEQTIAQASQQVQQMFNIPPNMGGPSNQPSVTPVVPTQTITQAPTIQSAPIPFVPSMPAPQAPITPVAPIAPVVTSNVDMSAVIKKIEELTSTISSLEKKLERAEDQIGLLRRTAMQSLVCLHHLYLSNDKLLQSTKGAAQDIPSFEKYLEMFYPQVGR